MLGQLNISNSAWKEFEDYARFYTVLEQRQNRNPGFLYRNLRRRYGNGGRSKSGSGNVAFDGSNCNKRCRNDSENSKIGTCKSKDSCNCKSGNISIHCNGDSSTCKNGNNSNYKNGSSSSSSNSSNGKLGNSNSNGCVSNSSNGKVDNSNENSSVIYWSDINSTNDGGIDLENSSSGSHRNGSSNSDSSSDNNSNSHISQKSELCIYHYVHYENSTEEYSVKKRWEDNLKCPWCSFHPGLKQHHFLLEHLKSCHFHFAYQAMYDTSGILLIFMVRDRELDNDFISLKEEQKKSFVGKRYNRRVQSHLISTIPIKQIQEEKEARNSIVILKETEIVEEECRQYYDPRTCIPLAPEEKRDRCDDADCESDLFAANSALDEHSDTPHEDRLFMKVWNEHVSILVPYADSYLPMVLEQFVIKYSSQIIRLHLRHQFLLHLLLLLDFGILRPNEMEECMKVIDEEGRKQKKN